MSGVTRAWRDPRTPAFAHADIRSLPQWGRGEARIKPMIITLQTADTTITRDTWKAGMIREHNDLGGPTSTIWQGRYFLCC